MADSGAALGGVWSERTAEGRALSLESYALVLAHLLHFGRARAPEVLERLGVARRDFDEAELRVSDALAVESMRGEEGLSRRFSDAFSEARATLARDEPALESLGPLFPDPAPPVELAAGSPPPPDRAPPLAPATGTPPPSELTQALPSPVEGSAWDAPIAPARREIRPVPPSFDATHEALPAFREPLPFSKDAAPSSVVTRPAAVRAGGASRGGEKGTLALPAILVDKDETLPFFRAEAGDAEALLSRLTLEQYASLSAELSVYRGSREAVMRRYGLESERTLMALDAAWSSRMGDDDVLRRRFEALLRRFSEWLSSRAGR